MSLRLLLLVVAAAAAGCSGLDTKKLAFNRYQIETPYEGQITYSAAVTTLKREAEGICRGGFRKVNDYDTRVGERRLLIWEITCRGVERIDTQVNSTGPRAE